MPSLNDLSTPTLRGVVDRTTPQKISKIKTPIVRVTPPGVTITEDIDSRKWTERGVSLIITRKYKVAGTPDAEIARAMVLQSTPYLYFNTIRDEIVIDPINADEITNTGLWLCTVRYRTSDIATITTEDSSSFDTTGGTQHITQSYATIQSVASGGKIAPDYKGGIGFEDGVFTGTDIPDFIFNFSETRTVPASFVTNEYRGMIAYLKTHMNNNDFMGFKKGEVLFDGAVGTRRGAGPYTITYKFRAQPNFDRLLITGLDELGFKYGWDYLWVDYEDAVDPVSKKQIRRPRAAYVERIIKWGNFGLLGIGVS